MCDCYCRTCHDAEPPCAVCRDDAYDICAYRRPGTIATGAFADESANICALDLDHDGSHRPTDGAPWHR